MTSSALAVKAALTVSLMISFCGLAGSPAAAADAPAAVAPAAAAGSTTAAPPSGSFGRQTERADLVNRQVLRVCADPANMPFSNDKGEGFENKIADIVAQELKVPVEYTYFPMATGFIKKTLFAKACDVVIGYAQGDDLVLNTNAYYRSTYALVYRKGQGLDGLESLEDPRLQGKRVGLIAGTPPSVLLARAGLMQNAKFYKLVVDRRYASPPEEMVGDIRSGEVAAGVIWGPLGGYYAKHGGEELVVVPLMHEQTTGSTRLAYRISMGVRAGEDDWKRQLNTIIAKHQGDIDKVLLDFGVPIIDEQDKPITQARK